MYSSYDEVNGFPPRFYRCPNEIKCDIRSVSARINEINERLNIRELLSDFLCLDNDINVSKSAQELSELLEYALEALDELKELNETLDDLKAELLESISIIE